MIPSSPSSYKKILSLIWPQFIMTVLQFTIGYSDIYVAGKISPEAQAAIGITSQYLFVFLILAQGFSSACIATISQSLGAKEPLSIKRYTSLCLYASILCGVFLSTLGLVFIDALIAIFSVPKELLPLLEKTLFLYILAIPFYYVNLVSVAVFRAKQKVFYPLFFTAIVAVLNLIGNFIFAFGYFGLPVFGYQGIAFATLFSAFIGSTFCVIVLFLQKSLLRIKHIPRDWIKTSLPYLVKVAVPATLTNIVWQGGYFALFAIVATLPIETSLQTAAIAGIATGNRIESLVFLITFSFSSTASILVGEELGAKNPTNAKKIAIKTMIIGILFISLLSAILWYYVDGVIAFTVPDLTVAIDTKNYLFWNLLATPFVFMSMTLAGVFTGAGATLFSFIVMGSSTWFVRIPLSYILGHLILKEANGVWIAMFISQIIQSSFGLYLFSANKWQKFTLKK